MKKRVRMPKSLLPKPSKIAKRGIYEMINIITGNDIKKRDYKKRIDKGKY